MPNEALLRRRAKLKPEANDVYVAGVDFRDSKASQLAEIDRFWAIDDSYAAAALEKLAGLSIAECAEKQAEFVAAQKEAGGTERKPYEMLGRTALLAIDGPLTKKPTSASFLFGGTSTIETRDALRAAGRDPGVDRVLLCFSSPGGQVDGTAELADDVREFRKPIASFIDGMCASAAYWIASQSDAIYANRTAVTANVGVKGAPLQDSSMAAAMAGIKVHQVTTGPLKSVGDAGVPITAEQVSYVRGLVKGLASEFAAAVQTGRNLSDEQIEDLSDGRAMVAAEALSFGLIDGICSFEECLAQFSGETPASTTTAQAAPDPAKASRTSGQGTQMALRDIVGRLRGIKPETQAALKAEGIDLDALDAEAEDGATVAQLAQQMQALRAKAVESAANAWFDSLLVPDKNGRQKAVWNQREGAIATFLALAKADGGGRYQFDAAENFVEGPALKAYKASMEGAVGTVLSKEQIMAADPRGSQPGLRSDLMAAGLKRAESSGRLKPGTAAKVLANLDASNGGAN